LDAASALPRPSLVSDTRCAGKTPPWRRDSTLKSLDAVVM
jgi:hypothetical protein